MFLMVASYSVIKLLSMVNHSQPDFVVNTVLKDMQSDYPEPFHATELNFEFAIAFISLRPWNFVDYDPRLF